MTDFRLNDRVRLLPYYERERKNFSAPDGTMATVVQLSSNDKIFVQWDRHRPSAGGPQWDGDYSSADFELVVDEAPKASAVDELVRKYATDLLKAIDDGTMAKPYSEIGIFADFLIEYRRLS